MICLVLVTSHKLTSMIYFHFMHPKLVRQDPAQAGERVPVRSFAIKRKESLE